jgi:hypothetical protein
MERTKGNRASRHTFVDVVTRRRLHAKGCVFAFAPTGTCPLGMCVLRNPKSLHKHKINRYLPIKHLHQLKMRNRLKMMRIKRMSHLKRMTMIKGEMKTRKMIKKYRVKDHHTQESIKQFNEITP